MVKGRDFTDICSRNVPANIQGYPTKDETLETIERNLFSPFSCTPGSLSAKTGVFSPFSYIQSSLSAKTGLFSPFSYIPGSLLAKTGLFLC